MITTTFKEFRIDIENYFNKVTQDIETLIINIGKDSGVVIISLVEYNALIATQHELSSSVNEQRLDAAIEKFRKESRFSKDFKDT